MAETKMTKDHLVEVDHHRREFRLSVPQCCYWLESQYGYTISRQAFTDRLEKFLN